MEELLIDMSLSSLVERCNNEISKYSRKEPFDDQYCLEIFRRAMLQHDEQAWDVLQQRFHDRVLAWIHSHPQRAVAMRLDSEENYVAQTFARFWQATTHNQKFAFNTLAAALAYLRASLNSAILDTLRAYARVHETPSMSSANLEEQIYEDDISREMWEVIRSIIPNELERRVVYLLYYVGLKPREIVRYYPYEFSDLQEIYRLRRRVMDRLQRLKANALAVTGTSLEVGKGGSTYVPKTYPAQTDTFQSRLETAAPTITNRTSSDVKEILSLFAIARVSLEDDDRALVGKAYSVQAGISQSKPENFEGEPFDLLLPDIDEPIQFDISLHAGNSVELTSEWQKDLRYDPQNTKPQLVEFPFKVIAPGPCSLTVDFYRERHLLQTISIEFEAVEQPTLATTTMEG